VGKDVAVIGAAGSCGRQLAMQLLERQLVSETGRLQLVGHRGGPSEHELWGLRSDLEDAFSDGAPRLELALDPEDVDADVVVMLAGATISLDPSLPVDRARLATRNAALFESYAAALARRADPPVVVVQSNPVEVGVAVFARHLPAHRVLGAAGWSDTLRFRHELSVELGVPRRDVAAVVLGQHGDHLLPVWSRIGVHGVRRPDVESVIARARRGRSLADLPDEVAAERAALVDRVRAGRVQDAWDAVTALPVDLRTAIKPFFTHFTSGHTTEAVTARAAADLVAAITSGTWLVVPAQVTAGGRWHGVSAPLAAPVVLGPTGWTDVVDLELADDERAALAVADRVVGEVVAAAIHPDDPA
jgi:malate dehydrogenase